VKFDAEQQKMKADRMKAYKKKQMVELKADQETKEAERKANTEKIEPTEPMIAILEHMIERLLARQEEMKTKVDADREQKLVRMRANMKTLQEEAEADIKADRENLKEIMKATQERMEANMKAMRVWMGMQIGSLLSDRDELKQEIRDVGENLQDMMKATQENIKSGQAEMRSATGAIEEKMDAWIANMKDDQEETMASQYAMETGLKNMEPNSGEKEAVAELQKIPNEKVAVHSPRAC
jgi:hypothetical protein